MMAIIPPWTTKYGYRAAAYPIITTKASIVEFSRRKRKPDTVILKGPILPIKCAVCKKMIEKGEANRTEIYPRTRTFKPMHYNCAWGDILSEIHSPEMMERFGQ